MMSLCDHNAYSKKQSKKEVEKKKKVFVPDMAVGDDTPHLHHISLSLASKKEISCICSHGDAPLGSSGRSSVAT